MKVLNKLNTYKTYFRMKDTGEVRNISNVIKRLELVKNFISLEEDDEIMKHAARLREFTSITELKNILALLETKAYSKAMVAIDAFINKFHQVTVHVDPELEGLRLETKILENEVNTLFAEKADLEKLIHEFGIRHNKELGELILKILHNQKEKAKGTPKESEAEKDYNEYNQQYKITKDEKIIQLTDDEQKELKQKYRKASKLCHPDVVSEDQKNMADALFSELNDAYERNDLKSVREILENLEKGNAFVSESESISEKSMMKAQIEKLKLRLKELKKQLEAIKESEIYKIICSIDNWDSYFIKIKQELFEQIKGLENGK